MVIRDSACCFNVSEASRTKTKVCWFLGDQCNLSCKHCSVCAETTASRVPSTPAEEALVRKTVKELKQRFPTEDLGIILSGGEPLLYELAITVANSASHTGISVSLATNGILLKQRANEFIDNGVEKFIVSLDSAEPTIHNALRNNNNAHHAAVEGIKAVKTLGKKVGTCAYIFDENIGKLAEIIRFNSDLGISQVSLSFPMVLGREIAENSNLARIVIRDASGSKEIIENAKEKLAGMNLNIEVVFSVPFCAKERVRKQADNTYIMKRCPHSGRKVHSIEKDIIKECIYAN